MRRVGALANRGPTACTETYTLHGGHTGCKRKGRRGVQMMSECLKVETLALLPSASALEQNKQPRQPRDLRTPISCPIPTHHSAAQQRPVSWLTKQDNPANGKEDPGQPDARPVGLAYGSKEAKLIALTEWCMGCRECGSRAPPRGPHTVNRGGSHRARKGRSLMRVLACHVLGLDDFLDM